MPIKSIKKWCCLKEKGTKNGKICFQTNTKNNKFIKKVKQKL